MIFVGRQFYGASGAEIEKIRPDGEKLCTGQRYKRERLAIFTASLPRQECFNYFA